MKPLVAFVGGIAVAGTVAFFVTRREAPREPVAVVQEVQVAPVQKEAAAVEEPKKEESRRVEREVVTRAAAPKARAARPAVEANPARVERPVERVEPKVAERVEVPAPPVAPRQAPVEVASTPAPTPPPAPPKAIAPPKPAEPNKVTLAAGTKVTVRLAQTLSTESNQVGDTFQATLDQPIVVDGFLIAERGARVEGKVSELMAAGKVKGVSRLEIELTRLSTSDGQMVTIPTTPWAKEAESERKSDAAKVAAGAGIGAALGAIFGGGKGAAVGAGTGAATGTGVVLATRGKPVILPTETRITFQLKSPVELVEKR